MRRLALLGVGLALGATLTPACGSDDETRKAFEGDAGEAGQSQADGGTESASGAGTTSPAGGAAGAVGSETDPGGAAGSAPLGSGGATGNFVPDAQRLALGGGHSCALKLDGTVACWGRGDHGELGDGEFHTTAPTGVAEPVAVTGLDSVAALTLGNYHSCALPSDMLGITCWGGGNDGQLGDGSFHADVMGGVATPQAVDLQDVIQVTAAGNHTCVLFGDTSVQCWGDNLFGQLGDGSKIRSNAPLPVPDLIGVAQIVAGKFQTCALMDDQTVQCWGSGGNDAQAGTVISLVTPTPIEGIDDASALAAGDDFTCAIVTDGAVKCWGEGDVGQLGDGQENDTNTTPVSVTGLSGIVQLSAGGLHACALDGHQALWCWGGGEFGQLGDGVFHNGFPYYVTEPVAAEVFDDVIEVACGEKHTCIRNSAQQVLCIGLGTHGQLGDGSFHPALPFGETTPFIVLDL